MRSLLHSIPILVTLSLAPVVSVADSIMLDGKKHDNVYVVPGTELYYVRIADTGAQISIPKVLIQDSDIRETKDPTQRRKILEAWKKKFDAKSIQDRQTLSYLEWKESTSKASAPAPVTTTTIQSSKPSVKPLTNVSGNRYRGHGKPKAFMDSEGQVITTNVPSRFANNKEYVEVRIAFDRIEIPKQFQRKTPTETYDLKTFEDIVDYYAKFHDLDKSLVYAVIKQESDGNPYAVSSAGARGLMQLMPGTALDMGVKDIFDPAQNIAGGTQYLSKMKKLFDGNTTLALAGYNAGPGNVKKYGNKVPPFTETQNYVRRVQQLQRQYQRYGTPSFDVADIKPVKNDYLPPTTTAKYYRIELANGLTVRADTVLEDGDGYVYVFEGKQGWVNKKQVTTIYDPV